jgi:hypothetical protein
MTHAKNDVVTHRGNRVEITAVHETYDVQVVDENGRVQLDANNQPRWTGGVDVSELSAPAIAPAAATKEA